MVSEGLGWMGATRCGLRLGGLGLSLTGFAWLGVGGIATCDGFLTAVLSFIYM